MFAIYEPIMRLLVSLIVLAGNARCPGHGNLDYMVRRVLADAKNRLQQQA